MTECHTPSIGNESGEGLRKRHAQADDKAGDIELISVPFPLWLSLASSSSSLTLLSTDGWRDPRQLSGLRRLSDEMQVWYCEWHLTPRKSSPNAAGILLLLSAVGRETARFKSLGPHLM